MKKELQQFSLSQIMDGLPENLHLYRDSGLWNILDDQNDLLADQHVHENLKQFLIRFLVEKNMDDALFDIRLSLEINL